MAKHDNNEPRPPRGLAREAFFSTRHMPVRYLDALHILMQKMEPRRRLWQVVNMVFKRGIRALAEEQGIENPLPPIRKNGGASARQERSMGENGDEQAAES